MIKKLIAKLKKIKPGTYLRTAALLLAIASQAANEFGFLSPLGNQALCDKLTLAATALTGFIAWWKNNSFTEKALQADELLGQLRACGQKNDKNDRQEEL